MALRFAALLAFLGLLDTPRAADACTRMYQSPYELFDEAKTVVHARVDAVAGGTATLTILTALKGVGPATKAVQVPVATGPHRSTCAATVKGIGVAYIGEHGRLIGAYDGFAPATPGLVATLTAYGRARTASERAAVFIDAIAALPRKHEGDRQLAEDSADAIAKDPALIATIDASRRAHLAAAATAARDPDDGLLVILLRTGEPKLERWVAPESLLARIAEQRLPAGLTIDKLAAIIEQPVADNLANRARKLAALDRCEQLRARNLGFFDSLRANRTQWADAGYACRNGNFAPEEPFPSAATDATRSPTERARLLVELIARTDRDRDVMTRLNLAYQAAQLLNWHPELLTAIGSTDRKRLIDAIDHMYVDGDVPLVLARIGVAVSDLERIPWKVRERPHAIDLARERKFEQVTSTDELANIMERAPAVSAEAAAAFERCERVWGRMLSATLAATDRGVNWRALARVCRRGVND